MLSCRSARDSFMVFREAKSLARTLPPLSKKSEVLQWMQPVWSRQQLDAFLFDCYKVPPLCTTRTKPRTRYVFVSQSSARLPSVANALVLYHWQPWHSSSVQLQRLQLLLYVTCHTHCTHTHTRGRKEE